MKTDKDTLRRLKRLDIPDADAIMRFREQFYRDAEDWESFRFTDHHILERLAVLLSDGKTSVPELPSALPGSPP